MGYQGGMEGGWGSFLLDLYFKYRLKLCFTIQLETWLSLPKRHKK